MAWIDVIDTAVKIGLGAFISAISAIYISKNNFDQDKKKRVEDRRFSLLEKSIAEFDTYTGQLGKLLACIDGVSKSNTGLQNFNLTIDSHEIQFLRIQDADYSFDRANLVSATSKFRVLGLTEASEAARQIDDLVNQIRDAVLFRKEIPSIDAIAGWRTRAFELRLIVYKCLGKQYEV